VLSPAASSTSSANSRCLIPTIAMCSPPQSTSRPTCCTATSDA
jgi:hypothetical protein